MGEIRVQYEHWMNYHSDEWSVRATWIDLEKFIEKTPEIVRTKLDEKLRDYLEHLEYQAYSAGFAAAIRLSAECFSELKEV